MEEAFAPIKEKYREDVIQNTWGHLAPKVHIKYYGYIIVATSVFRYTYLLDYDFKNLSGGPWLAEDVGDFMFNSNFTHDVSSIYRFDGWYKKFKNGNYQFGGGKFHKTCDVLELSHNK